MLATPDITKAQAVALVQAVLALTVAFGADVTQAQQDAILQLSVVLAAVLPLSDAVIRNGRSRGNAERAA